MSLHPSSSSSGIAAHFIGSAWPETVTTRPARLRPRARPEPPVALTDPASRLITDFSWESPLTIAEDRPIDEALPKMMSGGVRALIATRDDLITGLLTSYDLQGERPMQFLQLAGYASHRDIEIKHIMTPWEQVHRLHWQFVDTVTVAAVAAFLRQNGATHVLIIEDAEQSGVFLRGILSRTRLERQLGQSLEHSIPAARDSQPSVPLAAP